MLRFKCDVENYYTTVEKTFTGLWLFKSGVIVCKRFSDRGAKYVNIDNGADYEPLPHEECRPITISSDIIEVSDDWSKIIPVKPKRGGGK